METLIIILLVITIIMLAIVIFKLFSIKVTGADENKIISEVKGSLETSQREFRKEISESVRADINDFGGNLNQIQRTIGDSQNDKLNTINNQIGNFIKTVNENTKNNYENFLEMNRNMELSQKGNFHNINEQLSEFHTTVDGKLDSMHNLVDKELQDSLRKSMNDFSNLIKTTQEQSNEIQNKYISGMDAKIDKNLSNMRESMNDSLESMRKTMESSLARIQEDNQKKLSDIQATVNEKLESQMQKSFSVVSDRLKQVYEGLGEMQAIASSVGDLKKVLSNVKARGILGEIQLGRIIGEILPSDLYDTEVSTIPGKRERVEFAVKLPGQDGNQIYLPIDSKFPGNSYATLQEAYESGDKNEIAEAKKNLIKVFESCAKDIKEKYVAPPYTTNFGIMFLPFEGLYAEAVQLGLVETLQNKYNVCITGPSTMAAMLNTLQMGFRTLAIQKRSTEVWKTLGSVKKEFNEFGKVLEKAQKHISQVGTDLDSLVGVRTRAIQKNLEKVEVFELETDSEEQE